MQRWTFTRSVTGKSGGMAGDTLVAKDALVLDYGTAGNGYYEVNAVDGAYGANSPYMQIVTWAEDASTRTFNVNVRVGKLSGLAVGGANEYGLFAGTGQTTAHQWIKASDQGVKQNNVTAEYYKSGAKFVTIDATNGFQIVAHTTVGFLEQPRAYGFVGTGGQEAGGLYGTRSAATTAVYLTTAQTYPAPSTAGHILRLSADAGAGGNAKVTTEARSDTQVAVLELNAPNSGYSTAVLTAEDVWIGNAFAANIYIGSASPYGIKVTNNNDIELNGYVGIGGAMWSPHRLRVYGSAIVDTTLTVTGALTAGSYTTANGGSFNGGAITIQYASNPYLGVSIKVATGSSWTRGFGFNDGTNNLGGFGAYGPSGGLEHFWIGPSFGASSHVFVRNSDGFVGIGNAAPTQMLHVSGKILAQNVFVSADNASPGSTVGFTNVTTATSTGTGAVKMAAGVARNSDLWLKIYVSGAAYYVPCWSQIF